MRTFQLVLLALAPAAFAQDVTLETNGSCPGPVTIDATGLTPNGTAFVVAADGLGDFALPGTSCVGTNLGLTPPNFYKGFRADASGNLSLAPELPAAVCDRSVVVLDVGSCSVSPPASLQGANTRNVTFRVDMGCSGENFTTVYVTGPWNGWTDSNPLTDADGDGVWETTVQFPLGSYNEYKFMVDSWASQENLVDDMVGGATCAPVTDYFSYANRVFTASNDLVLEDTYGACTDCDSQGTVSFAVDLTCSGLTPSEVGLPGPDVGWDFYARTLTDGDGDGIWTGDFVFPVGTVLEYTIALDGWAMQEQLADDMAGGATCAPVTDYYSYANRQITINGDMQVDNTYDSCDPCP